MPKPISQRALFARIILATEVPTPQEISVFAPNCVSIRLACLADGLAWAEYLGAERVGQRVRNDRRILHYLSLPKQGGWHVSLEAADPTQVDDGHLDEDTKAALTKIADAADQGVSGTKK